MTSLTNVQRICLTFLDDKMGSTAMQIGREICAKRGDGPGGSNLVCVGATTASRLAKMGMVTRVRELNQWRITAAGRDAIQAR